MEEAGQVELLQNQRITITHNIENWGMVSDINVKF
tara:strand:- start:60 stop:164 length:105 start_codon:yes stop_codon:yes gene_type:complete